MGHNPKDQGGVVAHAVATIPKARAALLHIRRATRTMNPTFCIGNIPKGLVTWAAPNLFTTLSLLCRRSPFGAYANVTERKCPCPAVGVASE